MKFNRRSGSVVDARFAIDCRRRDRLDAEGRKTHQHRGGSHAAPPLATRVRLRLAAFIQRIGRFIGVAAGRSGPRRRIIALLHREA